MPYAQLLGITHMYSLGGLGGGGDGDLDVDVDVDV